MGCFEVFRVFWGVLGLWLSVQGVQGVQVQGVSGVPGVPSVPGVIRKEHNLKSDSLIRGLQHVERLHSIENVSHGDTCKITAHLAR